MSGRTAFAEDATPLKCEQTESALASIQDQAERGDANAQLDLAKLYRKRGCFPDDKRDEIAFGWIEKAAEQGLSEAQVELASSYLYGKGVKMDVDKGLNMYHTLATQNVAVAEYDLGDVYMTGSPDEENTIRPDTNKALFWYETAANKGMLIQAMNRLGALYRDQNQTFYDLDTSSSWFRKAAESGDIFAMIDLAGNLLKSNLDVSNEEAAEWYRKAAELGAAKAQYALARSYALGRGVQRDQETAYTWYLIAKSRKYDVETEFGKELIDQLSKAEILEAEENAKEWRKTHLPSSLAMKD